MTTVLVLTAVAVGYLAGRARPWQRLADWADWEVRVRGGRWATTRVRVLLLAAACAVTQPRRLLRAWRHRHDPPPPRSPAIQVCPTHTTTEEEIR